VCLVGCVGWWVGGWTGRVGEVGGAGVCADDHPRSGWVYVSLDLWVVGGWVGVGGWVAEHLCVMLEFLHTHKIERRRQKARERARKRVSKTQLAAKMTVIDGYENES